MAKCQRRAAESTRELRAGEAVDPQIAPIRTDFFSLERWPWPNESINRAGNELVVDPARRYKRQRMLRALIFDFDGLILDTETPEFRAWQQIYRLHGTELALEDWLPCIGTGSIFDPHQHMETLIGRSLNRDEVAVAKGVFIRELIARETLRPGVLATLETARERDLRIGLASSSSRDWVEPHLHRLGIAAFFETLQTGDLVQKVKPHPELYQRAVAALGVLPSEAVALEDSLNGLRAARTAGIFTIVIPNEMTRHLDLTEADLLLESLEDLDLATLPFGHN